MIKTLVVGPLEVNCYIVWDSGDTPAFVIDPGGDGDIIKKELARRGLDVKYIINTHGHFDHIGADGELKEAYKDACLAIHSADLKLLERAEAQGAFFGMPSSPQPSPDLMLEDGMTLSAGDISLKVIHTPGHSEGGVCLFMEREKVLFTGDTLFAGSIGRTDLPGGSYEVLIDSIKRRILPLGDDVRILPGHGPQSTIGEEKEINPFVTGV